MNHPQHPVPGDPFNGVNGDQNFGYQQSGPQQQPWGTPAPGFNQHGFNQQGFNPQQSYRPFDGNQENYGGHQTQRPKKTGLIIGLVALGLLVIGGIVTLILVLTGKSDPEPAAGGQQTPQQLLDYTVKGFSTLDKNLLNAAACTSDTDKFSSPDVPEGTTATTLGAPQISGDQGSFVITVVAAGEVKNTADLRFTIKKEAGVWCISGKPTTAKSPQ